VALVEAKRRIKDVYGAIDQAKRYSRHYQVKGDEVLTGGPWGDFRVPFVFSTNGRPFLEQLRTQSGVWFCDLTRPQNLRRPLVSWYSPQGLLGLLERNLERSHSELEQEDFNYNIDVRDYQQRAILAAEKALASERRNLLIAMATGTGKTKTSIVLVYRLLKTKRFRRVLFLVDRSALGEQAANAYKETRIENLQTFADIFEVKELRANDVDTETNDLGRLLCI
jgi:type I restriction enzyme R subunit